MISRCCKSEVLILDIYYTCLKCSRPCDMLSFENHGETSMQSDCNISQSLIFNLKSLMLKNEEEKDFSHYEQDIQPIYDYLIEKHAWFQKINEARQSAIIYMAFMGIKNFESFIKMISFLNIHDYKLAALEIDHSNFSKKFPKKSRIISEAIISGIV